MTLLKLASAAVLAVCVTAAGKTESPQPHYEQPGAVKVEVAPNAYCRDGSEYGPHGCAVYETAEPRVECPHPYKMTKEGICVTKTTGESAHVCPKGTYLDKHHCVAELIQPAEVYCKKGVLSKDETCLVRGEEHVVAPKFDEVKYDCPKGTKQEGDACYEEIKHDSEVVCPKGYKLDGHKCVSYEMADYYCKKGQLSKGGCVDVDVAPPTPSCPKHTKLTDKGECATKVEQEPTMVCEKGYVLSKHGKKCLTRVLLQAMPTKKGEAVPFKCHGKEDEKGNCYQEHSVDSVPVCEKGFVLHKNKCATVVTVPADYECPKGYETSAVGKGAECLKSKIYKPSCPKGFKAEKAGCVRMVDTKPADVCPKGTEQDGKHCTSVVVTPATPYCHKKDYELTKEGCVKPGYALPGKDKVYAPSYDCPKGYKLNKHEQTCHAEQKGDAAVVCEKGYHMEGKKCVAYHEAPPQTMCPKGFVGNGKECSRVTYEHPHFKCPKGSEDHGKKCYVVQQAAPAQKGFAVQMPSGKK